MKILRKAILPLGYKASGIACGIKKSGKPDVGLVYSVRPALTIAAFTSNRIQAAPVILNKEHLSKNSFVQAIVVNSGNANCFTGRQGMQDARLTADLTAKALGIDRKEVLVASTGIIGRRLPVYKIKAVLPQLVSKISTNGLQKFSQAIMTTDTVTKTLTAQAKMGSQTITVSASAKGAGMVAPELAVHHATMLAFVLTDADIEKNAFKRAVSLSLQESFNSITIDGCMSTNDAAFFMANGLAGNRRIIFGSRGFFAFFKILREVNLRLAKMLVEDAEGATKFICIRVSGARSAAEARRCAFKVANSNLLKTAIYGKNPNSGRIVAAVGSCGIKIRENNLKIYISSLKRRQIKININLNRGSQEAVVYTSDLTPKYVKINAEYN